MIPNKPPQKSAAVRIWNALLYSLEGLHQAWRDEQAFRQELVLVVILVACASFIPVDISLRLLLIFSMMLVLVVELVNSSIEAVTDLATNELHELAKKAKDCASAAVFISLLFCGVLWVIILYLWLF